MVRFAGVKNNHICIVSDEPLVNTGMELMEVPPELSHISPSDLMINGYVKDGKIKYKNFHKSAKQIKLALVGNWKMKCGISTYSEFLWPEVVKHVSDFKLFVEKNEIPTGDIYQLGSQHLTEKQVSVCWKRGESLQTLIQELKDYDPDIIWIQHEFGLWPNAAYWLSMMTQLSNYRVIVTMHSVFRHRDKTIVEAAMSEIVVHLEGGKKLLQEDKGINAKISVIPHGCHTLNDERLWNFYRSNKTFLQFGFGFRYKGWENAIRATAILAQKYPDVFFTGLFSESPHAKFEHKVYYRELMQLIDQLGIQNNVAILRGYRSDAALDSFLRTNQASIFPYVSSPEHEVFGASGAARMAMSKGLPVLTSSVNHFSDLPTMKADTPQELAAALEKLFTFPKVREEQLKRQNTYLDENTWEKVGLRYVKLFENEINDKK